MLVIYSSDLVVVLELFDNYGVFEKLRDYL